MTRRPLAIALVATVALGVVATPAAAALREVAVGNFYFDDASPGDGTVEANQGDQLRFTLYDGGPGTPHTVEVDALNIHSGSLAAGETFTTPPLDKPGTYTLYCKPHQNRGHSATLVVRATSTPTTAPPATAGPPATAAPPATGAPTTAPSASGPTTTPATTAPAADGTATSPTDTTAGLAGDPSDTENPGAAPAPPADESTNPEATELSDPTLVPTGRGEADDDVLASRPPDPDSLAAALDRPAARKGPWTRSVRLALLALVAMIGAVGFAVQRGRRLEGTTSGS